MESANNLDISEDERALVSGGNATLLLAENGNISGTRVRITK
jgi:hypothetical protein